MRGSWVVRGGAMDGRRSVTLLALLLALVLLPGPSVAQETDGAGDGVVLPGVSWQDCAQKGAECQWLAQLALDEFAADVAVNADLAINSDDDDDSSSSDDDDASSDEEDSSDADDADEDGPVGLGNGEPTYYPSALRCHRNAPEIRLAGSKVLAGRTMCATTSPC